VKVTASATPRFCEIYDLRVAAVAAPLATCRYDLHGKSVFFGVFIENVQKKLQNSRSRHQRSTKARISNLQDWCLNILLPPSRRSGAMAPRRRMPGYWNLDFKGVFRF
jgi:hypothetical protein